MNPFWSDIVPQLDPYEPGEQPQVDDLIKLNTNECPYGPSPAVIAAVRAAATDELRLYPDPAATQLKRALSERHGLSPAEVFVGNGSDEVLAHCFQGLLKHERPLLFADVTYGFYTSYCRLYQIAYEQVPVDEHLQLRVDDYFERSAGAIVIVNPNAPTGRAIALADVERLLARRSDVVVVVDEAYVDFGSRSASELVRRFANLVVVQTLSKSRALAGMRVGFAFAHPELIDALERVKNSFNSYPLDRLALAGATAAIEDQAYLEEICAKVVASRQRLTGMLQTIGFEVLPSKTNFLFVRHGSRDARNLFEQLRERHILVRHFMKPRIEQFLRISIGTDRQCDRLVQVLEDILRAQ